MAIADRIRKAMAPREETSDEIFMAISGIEDTQATRQAKRRKVFREQRLTTAYGTDAWQKLQDQLDKIDAEDAADERRVKDLWGLHDETKKREAAQKLADQDKAHQLRMKDYDQNVAAEMLASGAKFTEAVVALNEAWQHLLRTFDKGAEQHPAFADFDMNGEFLDRVCHAEMARLGKVEDDLQARHANRRGTVLSLPGSNAYHDFVTSNNPGAIPSLAEELTAMLAWQRDKVFADNSPRAVPVPQEELDRLSAAAGRKIHRWLKHPEEFPTAPTEMYDVEEPQATVQRADIGVDGVPVGRQNQKAVQEHVDAVLRGLARDPAALAALKAGVIPAIDLGTQIPNDRPLPADGQRPEGAWVSQQHAPPELIDTRKAPPTDPDKVPWQPGIEIRSGK